MIHQFFEILAYMIGGYLYRKESARISVSPPYSDRLIILAGALTGALLGSKLLHILEHLPYLIEVNRMEFWLGGKSVMGAFLGGTLGVEIGKKIVRWTRSTGDLWVTPLAVGLMIGRIGCQLSGPEDLTYGIPTGLSFGWDYGDGIPRHPTALYEIVWTGISLLIVKNISVRKIHGFSFALFLFLYSLGRFGFEFLKPPFGKMMDGGFPVSLYLGLTAIQWAAITGMFLYGAMAYVRRREDHLKYLKKNAEDNNA
jgi:phosphatidylglycerol---prolipoprotein diacylglyceryl transferase